MFGESLSGDSTTWVSENSEGRLTVRPFRRATIVPLDSSAEKASPSLVWAKSQQSLELVLWNLDSREGFDCGYRITGERGSYLEPLLSKFSGSGLIQFFSVQPLSPLCLCGDKLWVNTHHRGTEKTEGAQRLSN